MKGSMGTTMPRRRKRRGGLAGGGGAPAAYLGQEAACSSAEGLPLELLAEIFEYLDAEELGRSLTVCYGWYVMGSENRLWAPLNHKRCWGSAEDPAVDPSGNSEYRHFVANANMLCLPKNASPHVFVVPSVPKQLGHPVISEVFLAFEGNKPGSQLVLWGSRYSAVLVKYSLRLVDVCCSPFEDTVPQIFHAEELDLQIRVNERLVHFTVTSQYSHYHTPSLSHFRVPHDKLRREWNRIKRAIQWRVCSRHIVADCVVCAVFAEHLPPSHVDPRVRLTWRQPKT